MKITACTSLIVAGLAASAAHAQYAVTWSTIDGGGGTASGGTFTVTGTVGQPDVGAASAGIYQIVGGFWAAGSACYANCDGSTTLPVLNANDFNCFLNQFAAGNAAANCDGSTVSPVLNANDFLCFLNKYATGCS